MNLATVGYWRVSTDRQGREGVSLENQATAGERWCGERGCELVATFVEDESAWTKRGAKRPALERALAFIRAQGGRVRYLLVYDLSRFARSIGDQVRLIDELRALGVELQTVALELRDDAHGRAVAGYLGVTNQLQSDLASEKISATMLDVVRRGRSPHQAPFGYRNARDVAGGKIIEPDPERAPLVRRAFELVAAGVAIRAAHRELAAATLLRFNHDDHGVALDAPMPAATAGGNHVAEVRAFLTAFYGSGSVGQPLGRPARTITAKHRLGLVTVEGVDFQIVDIGMRMLEPHELLAAQFGRFAARYDLSAARTKSAKVRLIGNSVCPEVAEALVRANAGAVDEIAEATA